MHYLSHQKLERRSLLKGGTAVVALPFLESMLNAKSKTSLKRFVGINIPMGFHSPNFFPSETGYNYKMSSYLKPAEELRKHFTILSGTSLPGVDGGHAADKCFLTGAPHPTSRNFKNSISLDQVMAKKLGHHTRYASIAMGDHSLSWSANGVSIPAESRPDKLFIKLFTQPDAKAQTKALQELEDGKSVMDHVLQQAKTIRSKISQRDQQKLEQYFTAVRETELNLQKAKQWSNQPRPNIKEPNPGYANSNDFVGNMRRSFKVMQLILESDQSRIITYGGYGGSQVPPIKGVTGGYHALTHHGQNPQMIAQLELIDREMMNAFIDWLKNLKSTQELGSDLLESTHILFGSNLGSASGHLTKNLPIILAGGKFKHGQHIAFDRKNNEATSNAHLSILHAMGLKEKSFSSSKGLLKGLEFKS